MVIKKCNICDRRFKKTEHFKRHERSHTKEKPYECNVCHKRFSRSDVLSRHAKGHNDPAAHTTNRVTSKQLFPGIHHSMQTHLIEPHDIHASATAGHPSSLDFLADASTHHARAEPDVNPMLAVEPQTYFEAPPTYQPSYGGAMIDPMLNESLQLWLNPSDAASYPESMEFGQDSNLVMAEQNAGVSTTQRSQQHDAGSSTDRISANTGVTIPSERFAKVQHHWLGPSHTGRLISSLWRDVAYSNIDNIFAMQSGLSQTSSSSLLQSSRYGLDEDCRRQLHATFGYMRYYNQQSRGPINTPPPNDSALIALPNFPPAEILDMALDVYFRNFHPLLPFVHLPTFSAKNMNISVLHVMCLIGMALLGTQGTASFVSKNFTFVLEKLSAEMARCSVGTESLGSTMSAFAAAILFLNLAALTGEKGHIENSQMLYVNLVSIAQRHGLFSATEGQLLDKSLFESISDNDLKWKAWSKVESVKREALYEANNSMQWMQLVRGGQCMLMPTVVSPSENVEIAALDSHIDRFGMNGVLSIVQLRLSESYHRLLSKRASYPFAPCHTYAMDGRARCLSALQLQIASKYGRNLDRLDPNAIILWDNMCMNLTADIQIFELAAGRAGPDPARKALDNIAAWSQTPAARRACMHAAHVYKVMINRKASDPITFHSVVSLFSAALVLGLYIYTVPRSAEPQSGSTPIELLDDIDWNNLGTEGFTSFMEPNGSHSSVATHNPVVDFIRNGGTVYLRGAPFQGGYQSARRILLDYAGLLKDTGKWSVRKFSHVLYIMSDVLMDTD
ncbi:FTFMHR domain-containing protein [Aspergillus alliaceus]|uniref:FTFMHR domain-containing protein n=1 Tax=Petromyces alliaceus TaxID=209559 RepID=UPI0012A472E9|nr:uncharacterized protein BDW43DRAFT_110762 [Aspergillus alliaceus]KAB8232219.1 hypothetical protein BDW43DRAFT_110762 [Aspergillus alliaceus]